MERQMVVSGNLAEVGYDPDLETLEIMFRNGRVYQYYNVPAFMNERLMTADSLGKFLTPRSRGTIPKPECEALRFEQG